MSGKRISTTSYCSSGRSADRTRLRLLNLMGDEEVCVCFFVDVLGASQPKISRHLAYLRRAGVVAARRDGKWMHYRIVATHRPPRRPHLREVRAWLAEDHEMQRDRATPHQSLLRPQPPIQLRGAPRPASLALS